MHIVIAGGSGFLGSALARALTREGHDDDPRAVGGGGRAELIQRHRSPLVGSAVAQQTSVRACVPASKMGKPQGVTLRGEAGTMPDMTGSSRTAPQL